MLRMHGEDSAAGTWRRMHGGYMARADGREDRRSRSEGEAGLDVIGDWYIQKEPTGDMRAGKVGTADRQVQKKRAT
eukprot:5306340-Pleurochrysis_carterae.AAC.1